jgi:hypothetical protein
VLTVALISKGKVQAPAAPLPVTLHDGCADAGAAVSASAAPSAARVCLNRMLQPPSSDVGMPVTA